MSSFEKATIRLAWLAFFASTVAAIFIGLQWKEMKSGGNDTRALADAAKQQAAATKALAETAGREADTSKAIAEQAKAQTEQIGQSLRQTDRQIALMGEQAKTSRDIFDAAVRPYLGSGDMSIGFVEPGKNDINPRRTEATTAMIIRLQIKNFGSGSI